MMTDWQPLVLVVDDNDYNLQVLARILISEGYRVALAEKWQEVSRFLDKHNPDLILLDIGLPEVDGFEICRRLKQDISSVRDVPVVFISALEAVEDKVRGFSVGGADYITKPFRQEEVLARVKTHLDLRRSMNELKLANQEIVKRNLSLDRTNQQLAKMNDELEERNNRIDRDLRMARRIQRHLLPEQKLLEEIPELDVSVYYSAMHELGGDWYDSCQIAPGEFAFIMSDVSGHGVSAALIATMAKALFGLASYSMPGDCLTAINRKLFSVIGDIEYYLTAYLCKVDLNQGRIYYASAGHPPAFLCRSDDRSLHVMDSLIGFPLGMLPDTLYSTASIDLISGDRIMLYTDGILDRFNPDRELFQLDSFTDYVKRQSGLTGPQLLNDLVRYLSDFSRGEAPADDQCMMVIDYTGTKPIPSQPILRAEVE